MKLSTKTIAVSGIVLSTAGVPVGFLLDPGAAFLATGAGLLLGIAALLRGRKEKRTAPLVYVALAAGMLAFVVLTACFGGALFT